MNDHNDIQKVSNGLYAVASAIVTNLICNADFLKSKTLCEQIVIVVFAFLIALFSIVLIIRAFREIGERIVEKKKEKLSDKQIFEVFLMEKKCLLELNEKILKCFYLPYSTKTLYCTTVIQSVFRLHNAMSKKNESAIRAGTSCEDITGKISLYDLDAYVMLAEQLLGILLPEEKYKFNHNSTSNCIETDVEKARNKLNAIKGYYVKQNTNENATPS